MPAQYGFSSSSKAGFISGYKITQKQGGGDKKAGLIPSVGNDSWGSLFRKIVDPTTGRCCSAKSMATNMVFTKNTVRPLSVRSTIAMR
jgi:hypothetical protein